MSYRKSTQRVIDKRSGLRTDKSSKLLLRVATTFAMAAVVLTVVSIARAQELTPASTETSDATISEEVEVASLEAATVSSALDFLDSGELPQSIDQIRAMQARVKSVAERVKDATVSITMRTGQGTGVLVSSDGVILTAAHVIGRPRQMALVTFRDGTRARAITLGVEAGKDSGMLKILDMVKVSKPAEDKADDTSENSSKRETEADSGDQSPEDADEENADKESSEKEDSADDESADDAQEEVDYVAKAFENEDLPFFDYLDIGISSDLKDGQWVIAVGHPGGLDADRGMVLRVGRIINQRDAAIRTDCTLVGGDSGGPLVDMDGNVIAIHSRIGSRIQDNIHVPVDVFSNTWDQLSQGLKLGERGRLGLSIDSDSNIVSRVVSEGPADRAGINVGDIITAVDAKRVADKRELGLALSKFVPYQKVNVTIKRGSRELDLEVTLADVDTLKIIRARQSLRSNKKWRHP